MGELDHKEDWGPKKWCFRTVTLDKTLASPLDNKEIKPVHPKENQPWIFTGRTDAEAEAPILWPPDGKSWHWKTLMLGKVGGRRRRGARVDEMVGWYYRLNEHEFEQTPGDSEGTFGVLQPMGSQRIRDLWVSEQQQKLYEKRYEGKDKHTRTRTHAHTHTHTHTHKR